MALENYQKEVLIQGPFMDTSVPPSRSPEGIFPRLVGVDGRFLGGLRRFPGFELLGANEGDAGAYQTAFHHATKNGVHSFISIGGGTLSWKGNSLGTYGGSADITSVSNFANDIFIFAEGEDPQRLTGTGASSADLFSVGPPLLTGEATAPTFNARATSGGYLNHRGLYRVAYRFYDSSRKLRCGLSAVWDMAASDIAASPTGVNHLVTINITQGQPDVSFDKVEVFRSPNLYNPLDPYQGAIFYLEGTYDYAATLTVGLLSDSALVLQRRYDPWADPVMAAPQSGAGIFYQGSIFMGQDPAINSGVGVVWTNPYDESVEEFGSEYGYSGSSGDGKVQRFVETEDGLYGLTGTCIYFIRKSGGTVAIRTILRGVGIVYHKAAVAVGRTLYIMTAAGLQIITAGQASPVRAIQRIISDEWIKSSAAGGWGNTLYDVEMAYDSVMSCIFILNPTRKTMLCLWESTQAVTLLEGCPFIHATYGPDTNTIDESEAIRAFFAVRDGSNQIVTPSVEATDNRQMTGGNTSYEDSRKTIAANDSGGVTLAALIGAGKCVYCVSGTHVGTWGYSDGSNITYVIPWGAGNIDLVAQEVWVVDPILFKARFWPLSSPFNPVFGRKTVKDIGLKLESLWTGASGVVPEFKVGVMRNANPDITVLPALTANLTPTGNPSEDHVTLNQDGITLEPYVEQAGTHCHFELTGLLITGTFTSSDKVST